MSRKPITVSKIVADILYHEGQKAEILKVQTELEQELEKALDGADIHNRSELSKITAIKQQLDLCPIRIKQLDIKVAQGESLAKELAERDASDAREEMNALYDEATEIYCAKFAPFFEGTIGSPEIAVQHHVRELPIMIELAWSIRALSGSLWVYEDAKGKLKRLTDAQASRDAFIVTFNKMADSSSVNSKARINAPSEQAGRGLKAAHSRKLESVEPS